jgi:hypothetical protein
MLAREENTINAEHDRVDTQYECPNCGGALTSRGRGARGLCAPCWSAIKQAEQAKKNGR